MSRDDLDALFGDDALPQDDDLALFGEIARIGRRNRESLELAREAWEEGQHVDEQDVDFLLEQEMIAVAASDDPTRSFPVRYRGDVWCVGLGLAADGQVFALLESGPSAARLVLDASTTLLVPHEPTHVPDLDAPPDTIVLRLDFGVVVLLHAEP